MNLKQKMLNGVRPPMLQAKLYLLAFLLYAGNTVHAQSRTVTGQVKSENGEALIGVTVKNTSNTEEAITNTDGNFSITVSDPNTTLIFSYIGFNELREPLNGRTLVNITHPCLQ
jgi:hypothetical protein